MSKRIRAPKPEWKIAYMQGLRFVAKGKRHYPSAEESFISALKLMAQAPESVYPGDECDLLLKLDFIYERLGYLELCHFLLAAILQLLDLEPMTFSIMSTYLAVSDRYSELGNSTKALLICDQVLARLKIGNRLFNDLMIAEVVQWKEIVTKCYEPTACKLQEYRQLMPALVNRVSGPSSATSKLAPGTAVVVTTSQSIKPLNLNDR
jgi:hypothetical protein